MALVDIFQLLIEDYWANIQQRKSLIGLSEACDWYNSLIHLKNYSYERNITGATSRYKEIANLVLEPLRNRERWAANLEETIWDNFKTHCLNREIKFNDKVDPLKPSSGTKKSLEKFAWDKSNGINYTVTIWAFNKIFDNNLLEAHRQLKTVWGIGNKIASFYLRDVFWLGSNLNPSKTFTEKLDNLHLIQPIDIWIERAASALGCNKKSKEDIAKYIISFEQDMGLPPGGANIGFWMLGSNYLQNKDDYITVVKSFKNPHIQINEGALDIADYFVSYYGQFGKLLRKYLV